MKGDKWRRETRSGSDFGNQQPNLWEVRTPIASSYLGKKTEEKINIYSKDHLFQTYSHCQGSAERENELMATQLLPRTGALARRHPGTCSLNSRFIGEDTLPRRVEACHLAAVEHLSSTANRRSNWYCQPRNLEIAASLSSKIALGQKVNS